MDIDKILKTKTDFADYDWSQRGVSPCQPTPGIVLDALAEELRDIRSMCDCGCGAGRVVFSMAYAAGISVSGIELDPRRFALAEDNLRRCERSSPETAKRICLIRGRAQEVLPEAEAYYFFNPFPANVLRGVLKRMGKGTKKLFCYYADDDWRDVLNDSGWHLGRSVRFETLGMDPRERLDIYLR